MSNNYQYVDVETNDFFTTVHLAREEKRNAFNNEMIDELSSALQTIRKNTSVRSVLIRGKGNCFSAGADLNYMKEMVDYSTSENIADSEKLYDLFNTIYHIPIPTICYVHGASFGGSNGLIAACDYAIASVQTTFSFSEVRLGLLPATISQFVIQKIGEQNALDLFMTGRLFDANHAKEVGLVNAVVQEQQAEERIQKYLNLYKEAAPGAVKETKQLIRNLSGMENKDIRSYTAKKIAEARVSDEGQEGMTAFFEKRKPGWVNEPNE